MMNTTVKMAFALAAGAVVSFGAFAGDSYQEEIAKRAPRNMKLMVVGFGTIESMTQVEQWLGEQLLPRENLQPLPTLTQGEQIKDPGLDREIVRFNWNTRKMEYTKNVSEIDQENAHNKQLLTSLRTKVLANDATRYVPLAKEYLQASLSRRSGGLVQLVDRTNIDIAATEQNLSGEAAAFASAGCILTATLGDREEDSREFNVNARIRRRETVYTQPYTFKVRDLEGNVLVADSGTAQWKDAQSSTVRVTSSDPARKLIEQVCDQIAARVTDFFTAELEFVVKAPKGMDEDDAEVKLDGRGVDVEDSVKVLAVEHFVTGELDGCKPIRRVVELNNEEGKVRVKLVFKKAEAPAPAPAPVAVQEYAPVVEVPVVEVPVEVEAEEEE